MCVCVCACVWEQDSTRGWEGECPLPCPPLLNASLHAYITHPCVHTYIHTYIPYIHIYTHTHSSPPCSEAVAPHVSTGSPPGRTGTGCWEGRRPDRWQSSPNLSPNSSCKNKNGQHSLACNKLSQGHCPVNLSISSCLCPFYCDSAK